ncbi:MAG: hypothetical protein N3G76_01155 [Candidatus Micrarchaeota archaeon]|nr:hypothetical protein [Candidatus Micrarchaeota archaeon]
MESKSQLIAIKSLSSLLISLLAIIGIIFTLLTYFIISPSLASLDSSSKTIFSSLIAISDATAFNSKAVDSMLGSYEATLSSIEASLESTGAGVSATRISLAKLQVMGGYNFANETIQLKKSEDQLKKLKVDVATARENIESIRKGEKRIDEGTSTELLRASNEFRISVSSLGMLFTGATIIFILLFLCMILLSAEGLLS